MRRSAARLAISIACVLAASASAAPPPEGTCPTLSGDAQEGTGGGDVAPFVLQEGMRIALGNLLAMRQLFPPEVWAHREAFFFEGMRMEVGPCHRRYPVPPFYSQATLAHWEAARLDDDGNLEGYVAGLPFPPDRLDPDAPDAGLRWAWNLEHRYRGAGPTGSFRLTDMPSRIGAVETYEGSFFLLRTQHRADLADLSYEVPEGAKNLWVAGGRFDEPFHARHLAWRQLRPQKAAEKFKVSDRTWVYVPDMRKPRRAATGWVDGLFTPRYSASQQFQAGGGVPFMVGDQVDAINPTAGVSAAASENIRRGFVGLVIRPNAYHWTYRGERDVLAPLNASRTGYPLNEERNFGPSGLSLASDRWDLRRAVVIDGVLKRPNENVAGVTLYLDHQTQQPLYYISRRKNGLILDVGILAHRYSGDLGHYPEWPAGGKAHVFDPVAESFYTAAEGGTGWRRESYDIRSLPHEPDERGRMTSVSELTRGR
jgi:hypothetical protein